MLQRHCDPSEINKRILGKIPLNGRKTQSKFTPRGVQLDLSVRGACEICRMRFEYMFFVNIVMPARA